MEEKNMNLFCLTSGSNFFLVLNTNIPEPVDRCILTLAGAVELKKEYPGEIIVKGSEYWVPLTQEDTLALGTEEGHTVNIEMQANCTTRSVHKSIKEAFHLEGSLHTEIVPGNYPSEEIKHIINMYF